MAPEAPFDPKSILRTLASHRVDFVVIGGIAGIAHGSVLASFDLDIAYARDPENLERLAAALTELGSTRLESASLLDRSNFTFETRCGSLHIFGDLAGAPRYERLRKAAVDIEIEGQRVLVASLDHLIAMKEASGRLKDQRMAMEYRTLSDEIRRREG